MAEYNHPGVWVMGLIFFISVMIVLLFRRGSKRVGLKQSLMDRVYGRGTIVVNGSGNTVQAFQNVQGPIEFRKHVQIQVANKEAA